MRRSLTLLVIATLLSGCSTLYSSLPNRSAIGAASGMTVEQYAVGRLPGSVPRTCAKPAHAPARPAKTTGKNCTR
jgi:uncharacterized protein YceK